MVLIPLNIRNIDSKHKIIPKPKIGIYKGWFWFLNDMCMMEGPINIRGKAKPKYFIPLVSISLLVGILLED